MALKSRFERIGRGEGARTLAFNLLEKGLGTDSIRFLQVAPAVIERDQTQPRKDLGDLDGLRASIKKQGILQPLIVTALDDHRYRLIAGERRLTAARQLGLAEVPILVRGVEEQRRLVLQIVENLHRKDLSPLEEAEGVRRLMDESSLTQRDAAGQLGKSLTYINELLRVLQLPADVIESVRTSEHTVSKSLLLEITKQPDEAQQRQLWTQASSQTGLTVKQARNNKRQSKPVTARARTSGEQPKRADRDSSEEALPPSAPVWTARTKAGLVSVQPTPGATISKALLQRALEAALKAARDGKGTGRLL